MTDTQFAALYEAVLSLKTPEECRAFFADLCTAKELTELSSRFEVARLLDHGANYHDIVERTGASTATISRVSKALSGADGGYRTALSRLGAPSFRTVRENGNMPLLPSERAAYSLMARFESQGYRRFARSVFPESMAKEAFGDVTLSLIDEISTDPGTHKYCYYENILRPDERRRLYRRISQAGVECIGNVTGEEEREVLTLASEALMSLFAKCELVVMPLAYSDALFDRYGIYGAYRRELYTLLRTTPAGLYEFLLARGEEEKTAAALSAYLTEKRPAKEGLSYLLEVARSEAEIAAAKDLRDALGDIAKERASIDFTLAPSMDYYDGFFFVGRAGRAGEVLRGGRYDTLVRRHGHTGGAVGFAVYLDNVGKRM